MSLRGLCPKVGVAYSSLRRWRQRQSRQEPLLQKPGPKKVESLPLEQLRKDIEGLRHGARRTSSTGVLHRRYGTSLSRRDLNILIRDARLQYHRLERARYQHVEWLYPGLAWAMDTTEWRRDRLGNKLLAHGAQDLCSRYHFDPWVDLNSRGTDIAQWLSELWRIRPAPLLMKRDNGSPFNHPAVDVVLAEHHVIPLNSPPNYPRYNGGKERGFRELKDHLGQDFAPAPIWIPRHHRVQISLACHDLNHQPRPCLKEAISCDVESNAPRLDFSSRERQAIFNSIYNSFREMLSRDDMETLDRPCRTTQWRHAVESWLRCHDLIRVTINNNNQVSAYFHP